MQFAQSLISSYNEESFFNYIRKSRLGRDFKNCYFTPVQNFTSTKSKINISLCWRVLIDLLPTRTVEIMLIVQSFGYLDLLIAFN